MNVSLEKLSKSFGQKKVLDEICVSFEEGRINALLGENGAGKTTLASIICGALSFDGGELRFSGVSKVLKTERDALKLKVVRVNQNPLLSDSLSAMENILIGKELFYKTKAERKALLEKIDLIFKEWNLSFDKDRKVRYASGDERFFISLVSALCIEPEVLILDEPCSRLDLDQRKSFYAHLKKYVSLRKNLTVILITHSMNEAETYADTITVLVKGKVSAVYDDVSAFNRNDFAFSKEDAFSDGGLGENPPGEGEAENRRIGAGGRLPPLLKIEGLFARPKNSPALIGCSFEVEKNKITLIAGQQESGLSTLENILCGMAEEKFKGTVRLCSKSGEKVIDLSKKALDVRTVRSFLREGGSGILPTDKLNRGSNPALSVEQFLSANSSGKNSAIVASSIIKKAGVQIQNKEKVRSLSGGMLQKLMIEKELSKNPDFLILCNPLQGLDSRSESFFVSEMKRFVGKGKTILVLSSAEFPEEIADAVYFLEGGVLKKVR